MIKPLFAAMLAVVAVVLQGTVLHQAAPGGVTIDLALLLTLFVAWRNGPVPGIVLGLWCGALAGAAPGMSVAMSVLYALAGWTTGLLAGLHPNRSAFRAAVIGGGMALSQQGLESLVMRLAQVPVWAEPASVFWTLVWHGLGLGLMVAVCGADVRGWVRNLRLRRLESRGRGTPWTADWGHLANAG